MTRVAAVGDLHAGADSVGTIRPRFEDVPERAEVLLLAGDLTRRGTEEEGRIVASELRDLGVPVVAVLGNHDHHSGQEARIREHLEDAGVRVLEREGMVLVIDGTRLGVAGTKGFGGGFAGASASAFGEDEMKAFVGHTERLAAGLEEALAALRADVRIALLHYAPVDATLAGERLEIFPFLGSYLLAEAIDRAGADLVIHGHAHRGTEKGVTAGGVTVRNVAETVIGHAYKVYRVGDGEAASARSDARTTRA
ncbi:MAG TPA: metallophosphoesterase [Actinomycetota bacterium]|nr:metallophosphoesterase [Actinomycetota bacterium]